MWLGSSGGQCAPAPRGLSTSDVRVVVEPHKAHQKKAGDEARKIPSSDNTDNQPTSSESKNGKARLNLKVTVGAPGHSNLVLHQQKCCCVISKGRAFHRPTPHPPAPMGSGRTRKTVGFKSSSNKKPLGPLVQKQSTPQPNQPHGRAQLDMVVLLMWLDWRNAEAVCSSWGQGKLHPLTSGRARGRCWLPPRALIGAITRTLGSCRPARALPPRSSPPASVPRGRWSAC